MTSSNPPSLAAHRLAALRAAMRKRGIDAFIIPSSDPHLSEYLPTHWQGREWMSGFTGSAGTFVATAQFAGVWTDSRYWTQAESELAGSEIELMKSTDARPAHVDWLAENLHSGGTVAVDARVLGLAGMRLMADALEARGIRLRTELDLLDGVWEDRPALPDSPVCEHLPPYATVTRASKLAAIREAMRKLGADHHLVSTLDDIAWLLNLRGSDVSFNPVFVSHVLINPERVKLFIGEDKLTPALLRRLEADGVHVAPYANTAHALASLPDGSVVLLDPRRVTGGMRKAVAPGVRVIEGINPSTLAKSRKEDAEAANVRTTMEKDGAALCEFFSWLEATLADAGCAPVDEADIDFQITAARARQPGFVSRSFATIAGFNANGAIVHYRATPGSCATIEGDGLLLIDSGGQYLGGTTDITRVIPVGTPSEIQKRDCTLVLKGLINLSATRFPRGTRSPMLDAFARAPIWAAGIDYGHGTGHGVGYFLNVHEGPQSISQLAMPGPDTAMEPGMITSIEPGIYRPGRWGIHIENLVLNRSVETTEFGEYLAFETLTLCPIDTRCLDISILRSDEVAWLNSYHATVRARLTSHVEGSAHDWLMLRTRAI